MCRSKYESGSTLDSIKSTIPPGKASRQGTVITRGDWSGDAIAGLKYEHPQAARLLYPMWMTLWKDLMRLARSEARLFKYGSGRRDLSAFASIPGNTERGGRPSDNFRSSRF